MASISLAYYLYVGATADFKLDDTYGEEKVLECNVYWEKIRDVAITFTGDCPKKPIHTADFVVGYLTSKLGYTSYESVGDAGIAPDKRYRFTYEVRIKPIIPM